MGPAHVRTLLAIYVYVYGCMYMYMYMYICMYICVYMIQDPGPMAPPPKGRGGVGFPLKSMISVRNPCYGAPPERFPSGGALVPQEELRRSSTGALEMDSLQYSPPGIFMPHGVLDENVVKTYVFV